MPTPNMTPASTIAKVNAMAPRQEVIRPGV
jgi:hypothetical protein